MTARLRTGVLATVLASALLAGGCARVPTEGPIRSGSQEGLAPIGPVVGVEAQPPRTNAKPLAIVTGFLEAMSDSRTFDVARQYMTPEAASSWKPEAKIMVYDQSATKAVTLKSATTVELRAPLIGSTDERGSWTPAKMGELARFTFKLTQADGQYRVANVPPGAFLGSNLQISRLKPSALYFLNRERDMLVPDPVHLPANVPTGRAATQLVQALLKGPTGRLGNGVVSAAPPGTQVNVSVPVDDGLATVALSSAVGGLSDTDRELLAAQLVWTLRPISSRVRITVDGAPLLRDQPEVLSFDDFGRFDPSVPVVQMKDLYGVRAGKIHRIRQDGSSPIEATPLNNSPLFEYAAESFAVDLRGEFGAIVTQSGDDEFVAYARLEPGEQESKVEKIPTNGDVVRPSFDNAGNLWVLDRADRDTPRLRVRATDGKLIDIRTNWPAGSPAALRMAPDGVRALVLMEPEQGTGLRVYTAAVTTNDQQKLMLSQFKALEVPLVDITDAAWYQSGLLVAGKQQAGTLRQPWQVNVDGSQPRVLQAASTDFEAKSVAANTNIDTLPVVMDTAGRLHWQNKDLGWAGTGDDPPSPIDPVYPG